MSEDDVTTNRGKKTANDKRFFFACCPNPVSRIHSNYTLQKMYMNHDRCLRMSDGFVYNIESLKRHIDRTGSFRSPLQPGHRFRLDELHDIQRLLRRVDDE